MAEENQEVATIHENIREEKLLFHNIDILQYQGIDEEELCKLKNSGIRTIKGLYMCTDEQLFAAGVSWELIKEMKTAAENFMQPKRFVSALDVLLKSNTIFRVSTGSEILDALCGGGIESMSITEVFGESSSGKTQLSHTLCVTSQLPECNSCAGGKVVFIDTENTFRPNRLKEICNRFTLDFETVLANILYFRAYTSQQQNDILPSIAFELAEGNGEFKLLVIDSFIALFRAEFIGRGALAERQQKLTRMLYMLQKLADEYNIAVLITNQVTADPCSSQYNVKAIGGNVISHRSKTRIYFGKGDGDSRIAKLTNSPEMPGSSALFMISPGGICDVKV